MNATVKAISERYKALDDSIRHGRLDLSHAIQKFAWVVNKDKLAIGQPQAAERTLADDAARSIPFTITVLQEDRDGDIVVPMGCYLENYRLNSVIFLGHQENPIPIAKSMSPAGQLAVWPEQGRVRAVAYFDAADPEADFIYGKVKRGFLNAASVAFVPIEAYRREHEEKARTHNQSALLPPGWIFKVWDMTEWSIVGVPSNAGAIRDSLDKEKSFITPRLHKALQPYAAIAKNCWNGWCPCPPCEAKPTPSARKAVPSRLSVVSQQTGSTSGATEARCSGAPISLTSRLGFGDHAMSKKWKKAGKTCCGGCESGKPCEKHVIKNIGGGVQADIEGPGQIPGGRTGNVPQDAKAVGQRAEVLSGPYTGRYVSQMDTRGVHEVWVQEGKPNSMPIPDSKMQQWIRDGKASLAKAAQPSSDIDPDKACQILHDGTANGKPLTEDQRRMFGAACSRASKSFGGLRELCKAMLTKDSSTGAGIAGRGLTETSGTAGGYGVSVSTNTNQSNKKPNTGQTGASDTETPGFVTCPACSGSGNCGECQGHGTIGADRAGDGHDCSVCGGAGDCPNCGGVGNVPRNSASEATRITNKPTALGDLPAQANKHKGNNMATETKAADSGTIGDVDAGTADTTVGSGKPQTKASVDEPFNPKPSAQVLASLYSHAKAEHDYLSKELTTMDHPGVSAALKDYMDSHPGAPEKRMEHYKDVLAEHHPDHDMDDMTKGLEGDDAGPTEETGEAGLVDDGQVPPDTVDDKAAVDEPFDPDPTKAAVDEPFNPDPHKSEDRDTLTEGPAAFNKNEPASDPDTEEILERYRHPKSGQWMIRKFYIRRAADGRKYLVAPKELTNRGKPQHNPGTGGDSYTGGILTDEGTLGNRGSTSYSDTGSQANQAANAKHGEYIVGSGQVDWGKKSAGHHNVITKASKHLDALTKAPDLPTYHKAGLEYHSSELVKVAKDIEGFISGKKVVAAGSGGNGGTKPAAAKSNGNANIALQDVNISPAVAARFDTLTRKFHQLTGMDLGG